MTFLFFLVVLCSVLTFCIAAGFFYLFVGVWSCIGTEERVDKTSRCGKCKHFKAVYIDGRVICDKFGLTDQVAVPDECNEIDSEK